MTDIEVLRLVLSCIDPTSSDLHLIRRNGRILLGLPNKRGAARRALGLYQPQRPIARMLVTALRGLARFGLHGCVLPSVKIPCGTTSITPHLPDIEPGTCGILLGSPEHRVRRAVASYQKDGIWEVAKISFGEAGARVLEQEARTLEKLHPLAAGVPSLLGLHQGDGMTVMRMPYLKGRPVKPGEITAALALLDSWISKQPLMPIHQYDEWNSIQKALEGTTEGEHILRHLSSLSLKPVICHGDFARWNLLSQPNGELIVLDWEWGHEMGIPGIDLVHYFLQDARLVERLSPIDAIEKTRINLNTAACRQYLHKTGWECDLLLPIIASLAYKQGAGHQENREMIDAILKLKL